MFSVIASQEQNGISYFLPIFSFYTPWKHQKTKGFVVLLGGIKCKHLPEVGFSKSTDEKIT